VYKDKISEDKVMHIGIVAPCQSGPLADLLDCGGADVGCGGYLVPTLVRALVERRHRVSVITLSSELKERRIFTGPRLTYYAYPMRARRGMRDLYRVERQGLTEGIGLAEPDLLHAHWTYEFALACFDANLPTLVSSHDNAFQGLRFKKDLHRLGRLYIQLRVIRNAHFLTAVSPYLAASLRWLTSTKIAMIPNAIKVTSEAKALVQRAPEPVRIATILNLWLNLKNPTAAIKAFSLLRYKIPEAEMFMYGNDFEEGGIAAQWATSQGLQQNIHFRGFVRNAEMLQEISSMSMLLHPSLEESCPMALIEAMSLGIPVVGGKRAGGVPWVLDEGRAGFLTDVRNPQRIAETMLTCIEQTEEREQRRRNAYDRVLRVFAPHIVAEQYEIMYDKVLASS
jgi:glycosyltransferase involved in cell wall biosynthesis